MRRVIESIVQAYESGEITRAELVDRLETMTEPPREGRFPMRGECINHVTISASDPLATRSFYEKLLDAPVIGESEFEIDLGIGGSFLAIMKVDRPIGIDHFCVGVPGYDPGLVAAYAKSRGLEPRIYTETKGLRFKEPQVYVPDPDGILVQFSRPGYAGEMPRA